MNKDVQEILDRYDMTQPDFDLYREMRESCPVAKTGIGWLLTRYEDVTTAARDDDVFASGPAFGHPSGIPDEGSPQRAHTPMFIPIMLDPPVFWKYRRLLNPQFTPTKAKERESEIRALATRLIDQVIESGECDMHADIGVPLPAILTSRILGVPEEEWRFYATPVHHLLHEEEAIAHGFQESGDNQFDPLLHVVNKMLEIVEERRRKPKDDLLTFLAQAEVDGQPLTDYEIGGIAMLVVIGGVDTTTGAIASALVYLGRHPELRQRLIDRPSLIPSAVEEFLRAFSPVQALPRLSMQECTIGEQVIGPGELVMLGWGAANRDPDEFEDPDEVVIDREPNRHVAFGVGIHRCLGSNLARVEFRVALEEVLRRMPDYELIEDGVQLQPNAAVYGYAQVRARFTPGKRELVSSPT